MNKLFKLLLGVAALIAVSVQAQDTKIASTFFGGQTNANKACDAFIPEGEGVAKVTEINVNGSANLTTLKLVVYAADAAFVQTSTNSTTTIFVQNTNAFAANDNLIFKTTNALGSTYEYRTVSSLDSGSIVINAAPTQLQGTNVLFWKTRKPIESWVINSGGTANYTNNFVHVPTKAEYWFPAKHPSLIRSTNTTAGDLKLFISGYRQVN